jgi:hypothetical protein
MKPKKALVIVSLIFTLIVVSKSYATTETKSMTLQGPVGLIMVPTAYAPDPFGLCVGYHYMNKDASYQLAKVSLAPIPNWEIGGVYDKREHVKASYMIHTKYIFYKKEIYAGIGANIQLENVALESEKDNNKTRYQGYIVITWRGFFETSAMLGKTFGDDTESQNIDFGIGFQKTILLDRIKWMADFTNYNTRYRGYVGGLSSSYSWDAGVSRGIFNTGIRIEVIKKRGIRWNVDILYLDVLDATRHFGIGTSLMLSF